MLENDNDGTPTPSAVPLLPWRAPGVRGGVIGATGRLDGTDVPAVAAAVAAVVEVGRRGAGLREVASDTMELE